MYAISHAASALLIKKRYPTVPIWPILVSVQLVELLWCVLVWAGIERVSFHDHHASLDFLPYSHSIATGVGLGLLAVLLLWRAPPRMALAVAVGIGIVSHVLLDIVQHEPDIHLLPAEMGPAFGLSLMDLPWLNLVVEIAFGVFCWRIYGGSRRMLVGIVLFNGANLPTMLQPAGLIDRIAEHPWTLPAIILFQIAVTWLFIAYTAGDETTRAAGTGAGQ
jgi:hypothetical protein